MALSLAAAEETTRPLPEAAVEGAVIGDDWAISRAPAAGWNRAGSAVRAAVRVASFTGMPFNCKEVVRLAVAPVAGAVGCAALVWLAAGATYDAACTGPVVLSLLAPLKTPAG